jgi:hypothetical protein
MSLVVRTAKLDAVKLQLLSSLELGAEDIIAALTNHSGITLLNLNEITISILSSVRNIEALLLDKVVATELLQSTTTRACHQLS